MTTMTQTRPAALTTGPAARREWHLTFGGILRAEVAKVFSLRSSYWLLALMVAGYAALGALFFLTADAASSGERVSPSVYVLGAMPGQILIIMLGALMMAGEYSTGAIRSTLAAVPRRTPVLAAKAIVLSVVTAAIALISSLACVAASLPFWPAKGTPQFTSHFAYLLGAEVFYLVAMGLIALGLGTLIRATAGALTAGLGLVLIVPMVLQGFFGSYTWAQTLYKFMPDAQMTQLFTSPFSHGAQGLLAGWASGLVLIGWVVLALGAAAIRLRKSDA